MADLSNLLLLLVILINFFALGSSRLAACIRAVALLGGVLALLAVRAGGHASSTFQYCTKNLVRRPLVHGCPMNVNHHHRSINRSTGPWLTGLNSTRSNSKRIRPHRSPAWS